jgi:hypothetical protein
MRLLMWKCEPPAGLMPRRLMTPATLWDAATAAARPSRLYVPRFAYGDRSQWEVSIFNWPRRAHIAALLPGVISTPSLCRKSVMWTENAAVTAKSSRE